jgi:hypothetical protein
MKLILTSLIIFSSVLTFMFATSQIIRQTAISNRLINAIQSVLNDYDLKAIRTEKQLRVILNIYNSWKTRNGINKKKLV